jgi:hypothetical protein
MSRIRELIRDLFYPAIGLVSFAYLVTHEHTFLGLIALLLTVLFVVKSIRLRKRQAAEVQGDETESH